jgi:hypothetical protein
MVKMSKKVPIGIMPKHFWEIHVKEDRLRNLLAAMERYENANEPFPNEWFVEYLNLTVELGFYLK